MDSVGDQPTQFGSSRQQQRFANFWRQSRRERSGRNFPGDENVDLANPDDHDLMQQRSRGAPASLTQQSRLTSASSPGATSSIPRYGGRSKLVPADPELHTDASAEENGQALPFTASLSPFMFNHDWIIHDTPKPNSPTSDRKGKRRAYDSPEQATVYDFRTSPYVTHANQSLFTSWRDRQLLDDPRQHTSRPADRPNVQQASNVPVGGEKRDRLYLAGPLSRPMQTVESAEKTATTASSVQPLHFGLPSAYTHGGNRPRDEDAYGRDLGGALMSLPSFLRFDNTQSAISIPSRPSGLVSPGDEGVQHPQQATSLQYSGEQSRYPYSSYQQALASSLPSTSSSPHLSNTPLRQRPGFSSQTYSPARIRRRKSEPEERLPHRAAMDSPDSSEGRGSASIFTRHGQRKGSASTGLTSVRDQHSSKKASAETGIGLGLTGVGSSVRNPNRSRSGTASTVVDSERRFTSERSNQSIGKRRPSNASSVQSIPSMPETPTGPPDRSVGLHQAGRMDVDRGPHQKSSTASTSAHRQQIPYLHATQSETSLRRHERLSTITGSPQGASRRSLSDVRSSTVHSTPARANEARSNTDGAMKPLPRIPDRESRPRVDEVDTRSQASRHFRLLQQLHLEEINAQRPDESGWLEPVNGCESVFMPRPTLRSTAMRSARSDSRLGPSRLAAYERHHREASLGPRPPSQSNQRANEDSRGNEQDAPRSLFHHRMPPPTPDVHNLDAITDARSPSRGRSPAAARLRQRHAHERTPALTPNITSDEESDEASTPDLATVIAQGQQLDMDRERWRRQYRRGLDGGVDRVRKASELLHRDHPPIRYGDDRRAYIYGNLRSSVSTPDLRGRRERDYRSASPTLVPRLCLPTNEAHDAEAKASQDGKSKSKSTGNISAMFKQGARPLKSAISFCFPTSEAGQDDSDMTEKVDAGPARAGLRPDSSYRRSLGPSGRGSMFQHHVPVPDELFIISAAEAAQNAGSTRNSSGTMAHMEGAGQSHEELSQSGIPQFAAAFSAPRPDLSGQGRIDPVTAQGRFATAPSYHRPANSNDLRQMLQDTSSRVPVGTAQKTPVEAKQYSQTPLAQRFIPSPQASNSRRRVEYSRDRQGQPSPHVRVRELQDEYAGHSSDNEFAGKDKVLGTNVTRSSTSQYGSGSNSPREDFNGAGPSRGLRPRASGMSQAYGTNSYEDDTFSQNSLQGSAPRELWNADIHPDDAFHSLFFRAPRAAHGSQADLRPSGEVMAAANPSLDSILSLAGEDSQGTFGRIPRSRLRQTLSSEDMAANVQAYTSRSRNVSDVSQHRLSSESQVREMLRFTDENDRLGIDPFRPSYEQPPRRSSETAWNESSIGGDHNTNASQQNLPSSSSRG